MSRVYLSFRHFFDGCLLFNSLYFPECIRPTNPILGEQIFIDKLREQFFELRGFGVVDVVDDIGKPFMGIDLILFAGAEETVKHGDVLSRFMVARKEVIFSA